MTDPPRALVVGIGNPDRGDDGFGSTVARSLRGRVPPEISILERRGDILALIDDWNSFSTVIIVDAMASIGEPGRIHRFELTAGPLPVGFAAQSTHAFGVAEVIELARSLGKLPQRLVGYFIEGERFKTGQPISPLVAKAVDEATERIIAELRGGLADQQVVTGAAAHA
jgi:hydrogenase maturation protease